MIAAARRMVVIAVALAILAGASCAASDLRAGPWPERVAGRAGFTAYFQGVEAEEAGDMAEAVRFWRQAVRAGNVEGAYRLADLYFPLGGSFGNERLAVKPSFVAGFVWLAIAAAGLNEEEDMEGRSHESMDETLAMMERLLVPSERQQAKAILAAWPEALPPDFPVLPLEDEGPYPDETSYITALFRYLRGSDTRLFSRLAKTEETVQKRGLEELSRRSEAGDDEATFAAAWCRMVGLGTEFDPDSALPYMREVAEKGDGRALMALVHDAMLRDDEATVDDLLRRAADAGNTHALLLLAGRANDQDDKAARIEWLTRALDAGSIDAVSEMIGIGETQRDFPCMVQWLAAYALAREGTAAGYRSRLVMAMLVDEMDDDDAVRAALEAGERWAVEHSGR